MDPQRILRAVDAHSQARERLSERAERAVLAIVARFDGWYDHPAIGRMAAEVVRVVESAQRATATITDAYLARVASEVAGRTVLPTGVVDPADLRQGVTHAGVYGRLADQYRFDASRATPAEAIRSAIAGRASAMVATDLQLAFTHQAARFTVVRRMDGFRRVIRPELSRTGVCGLCIAASDQVYSRGNLLPLHANCHCSVLPIINGVDPGRSLNGEELDRLYDEAGTTRAQDLIRTRYRVEENGEIGPVLVHRDHDFRGPEQVAAA